MALPGGAVLSRTTTASIPSFREILAPSCRSFPLDLTIADALTVVALTAIALLIRMFRIQFPSEVIFDEVYFGNFTNDYIHGRYFHDIHPPLAKLVIASLSRALGYNGSYVFDGGLYYNSPSYITLRMIPAFFSAAVVPIAFLTVRTFGSYGAAIVASIIFACDPSLIVMGRFILTDGILHFFAALAIFSVFLDDRLRSLGSIIFKAVAIGFALAVKYTAGGILLFAIYKEMTGLGKSVSRLNNVTRSCFLVSVACVVQLVVLWVHLRLLPFKPRDANEICPQIIRNGLIDDEAPDWRSRDNGIVTLFKVPVLFVYMIATNFGVGYSHPYASHAATWPLFIGKWVLFYAKDNRIITCMGNWFVWWPVFGSVVGMTVWLVGRKRLVGPSYFSAIIFGYAASYLPLFLLSRDVFLYHYAIPLLFGVYLLVIMTDCIAPKKLKGFCWCLLVTAAVLGFVLWAPLVYGLEVSDLGFLTWLTAWAR